MSRRGSWDSCVSQSAVGTQLPATAVPTVVKVCLALVPRVVMAAMQTTMIRASMTAYSTAVGPSSRFMKSTTAFVNVRMTRFPFKKTRVHSDKPDPREFWAAAAQAPSNRPHRAVGGSRMNIEGPSSAGGRADGVPDSLQPLLSFVPEGRDGGDADHDDQGQHDRVLD